MTSTEGLIVRPTGAVAAYASAPKPPREAAAELGVDVVVDGTVQRQGPRLRVSVQVVPREGGAGARPWAAAFDAEAEDAFSLQDALAGRISEALQVRLAPLPSPRAHAPRPAAYEAFLRGRYLWSRFDVESVRSIGHFGEAASLDPTFASAHAGLALAHLLLALGGVLAPAQGYELAAECLERARRLDDSSADVHLASGLLALFRDRDLVASRRSLERAVALGSAGEARPWLALVLAVSGDTEAARRELALATEADPLSGLAQVGEAFVLGAAGEPQAALYAARRAVELRPERFLSHFVRAGAALRAGRPGEAVAAARRARSLNPDGAAAKSRLASALAVAGETEEARHLLAELAMPAPGHYVARYLRAGVLACLGDVEGALVELEAAAEAGEPWLAFVGSDPALEPLRNEPRFRNLERSRPFRA
jgi:serine/threonine-protein kinase